jgi:hypothetical protein
MRRRRCALQRQVQDKDIHAADVNIGKVIAAIWLKFESVVSPL